MKLFENEFFIVGMTDCLDTTGLKPSEVQCLTLCVYWYKADEVYKECCVDINLELKQRQICCPQLGNYSRLNGIMIVGDAKNTRQQNKDHHVARD